MAVKNKKVSSAQMHPGERALNKPLLKTLLINNVNRIAPYVHDNDTTGNWTFGTWNGIGVPNIISPNSYTKYDDVRCKFGER